MRSRHATAAAAFVVGLTVTVVGCGVPTDDEARRVPRSELPFGLGDTEPPDGASAPDGDSVDVVTQPITLYFVADGRLVARQSAVAIPLDAGDVVDQLATRADRTARSVIQVGDVQAVDRRGPEIVLDLSVDVLELPTAEQVLALGQLVMTFTSLPGVTHVSFTVADQAVAVPLPGGQVAERSVTRRDYAALF